MSGEIPEDVMALAVRIVSHCQNTPPREAIDIVGRILLADRASDSRLQAARAEAYEEAAKIAEAEAAKFDDLGRKHPEDSGSRDRCFARARSAIAIAAAIRKAKQRGGNV
jgi:hypothetical protein